MSYQDMPIMSNAIVAKLNVTFNALRYCGMELYLNLVLQYNINIRFSL